MSNVITIEGETYTGEVCIGKACGPGYAVESIHVRTPTGSVAYHRILPDGWEFFYTGSGNSFNAFGRFVEVGERNSFLPEIDWFATLLHEIGHALDLGRKNNEELSQVGNRRNHYCSVDFPILVEDINAILDEERAAWTWTLKELKRVGLRDLHQAELTYLVLARYLDSYVSAVIPDSGLRRITTADVDPFFRDGITPQQEEFRQEHIKRQNVWVLEHFPHADYDLARVIDGGRALVNKAEAH